jgi:murein DD-endopeptidase MepM/ murein hydrolase activator NlpD
MRYSIRSLILPLASLLTFLFILLGLYFKAMTPSNSESPVEAVSDLVTPAAPAPVVAPTVAPPQTPQQPVWMQKFVTLNADQASLSPQFYRQVQKIFQGVVPLNNRSPSDRFTLMFEETFLNDKAHSVGNILLATVTHLHKTYEVVRYTDRHGHSGYYTLQGKALIQSMFLPAPVKYKRISDRFSMHRWHPILHIWRPHLGIDYAAPVGTPVHAIASGRIAYAGWGQGYGNMLMIRHDEKFQSLYAHLSKFNPLVKEGTWVQQGEVIGYVGATGLATGPHLHFGLYEYGVARNPGLFLPSRFPKNIPAGEMSDFLAKTNQLLTHLAASQTYNTIDG